MPRWQQELDLKKTSDSQAFTEIKEEKLNILNSAKWKKKEET